MDAPSATPAVVTPSPTPKILAWALWGLALLLVIPGAVLMGLNFPAIHWGLAGPLALVLLTAMVYTSVGGLIGTRLPRSPIGWLLSAIGLVLALTVFVEQYGLRGLATAPGSLPATRTVASLGNGGVNFVFASLLLIFLLFPDGHPPSRRWRPVVWLAVAVDAVGTFGFLLMKANVGGLTNSLLDNGVAFQSTIGVYANRGVPAAVLGVTGALAVITAVAAIAGLLLRRRRGAPELRQQLAWLGYVAVIAVVAFLALLIEGPIAGNSNNDPVSNVLFILLTGDLLVGIPLACGVAVLRYRLYDLDIVVKKTVVFGGLVALFTAVYAAVVIGVGAALGHRGNAALTFAAAAIAAILFQPARARVRRFADRLVYGERATPYELLSQFSDRLAGAYSTEDVLPRMAELLAAGTGASAARVWLRIGDELRPAASWPADLEGPQPLAMTGDGLPPSLAGEYAVEIGHQGSLLGALTVAMPPSDPMNPAKEKLVANLASQAGLVLRNVRLTEELRAHVEELRASRQRLVAAQDEERRRLERNIHDGAQQQLVAIAIKQRLAEALVRKDAEKAAELLSQLQAETTEALEDLRELARGIYPPLLADQGLVVALQGRARRSPIPVTIDAAEIGRYPQEVEAAVYFCCLEALQNVAKYANASQVQIAVNTKDGNLRFTVDDDGTGFDAAKTKLGSGLRNMTDRLAALGGRLEIRSSPGAGTMVEGELPILTSHPTQ